MEHTRGSPRLKAIRVRTRVSPSIRSVFARRRRREVRIEAASTTWLSIASNCSTRVDPEAVQTGLLHDDNREVPAGPRRSLAPELGEPTQQPRHVTRRNRMLGHLL